jgi:hypothetical protein
MTLNIVFSVIKDFVFNMVMPILTLRDEILNLQYYSRLSYYTFIRLLNGINPIFCILLPWIAKLSQ